MDQIALHPVLMRQLRKCGIDPAEERLAELLARVSRAYADADQERYTTERSLSIVSDEMRVLHENLRKRKDAIHAATLEASDDGVYIVDEHGALVSFNRAFLKIFRLQAHDVGGATAQTLRAEVASRVQNRESFLARIEEIYADPKASAEDEFKTADNRVIARFTAPVIDESGALLGRVWFFRDVTDARMHEIALRVAKDDAERASKTKSAFLANMSHELRTPLNSILGFGRVLRRANLTEDQRDHLGHIVKAGEHMLDLVNDLLDLRRLEDDGLALERTPVDVRAAIDEATAFIRPLAEQKRQSVTVATDGVSAISADRRAVVQILANLLSNAAKFTNEGGRIVVSARQRGSRVELAVQDNGIGISADGIRRLFHYYSQLDGRAEHGMKGSGIGLALTRALVEKLGGEITVESTAGVGSTFRFVLDGIQA